MHPNELIDAPPPLPEGPKDIWWTIHRIFFFADIALWSLFLIFSALRVPEVSIIAMSILLLFNILVPGFIYGARGWKRYLFAYAAGLAFVTIAAALLFRLESWAGWQEMSIIGLTISIPLALISWVFFGMLVNKSWPRSVFFLQIALRTTLVSAIVGIAMLI
ncbi:MAG: hypothetical protein J0L99_10165 [Chitinophagales bacterium]|nr:hypothetical protein [Chitinophagales bacterium]